MSTSIQIDGEWVELDGCSCEIRMDDSPEGVEFGPIEEIQTSATFEWTGTFTLNPAARVFLARLRQVMKRQAYRHDRRYSGRDRRWWNRVRRNQARLRQRLFSGGEQSFTPEEQSRIDELFSRGAQ